MELAQISHTIFVEGNKTRKQKVNSFLGDISGSLGDLGTLIPLLTAMIVVGAASPDWSLIWMGAFFIFSGLTLNFPLPIQPMKAIAAIAIIENYTPEIIVVAGLIIAGSIFFLAWTGILTLLQKKLAKSLVIGIQLSLGLKLALMSLQFLSDKPILGWDGLVVAIISLLIILASIKVKMLPAALILFLMGLTISFFTQPSMILKMNLPEFTIIIPSFNDLIQGLELAAVQLPLTVTNSIIASVALISRFYPNQRLQINSLGYRIAFMNFLAPIFGGIPMCHGASGIAAWHRFGARTSRSMLFFGGALLFLGIFFSSLFLNLLNNFPLAILAVMLLFVSLELCSQVRRLSSLKELLISIFIGIVGAFINIVAGLILGVILVFAANKIWPKLGVNKTG
jgi:hypothetical protein